MTEFAHITPTHYLDIFAKNRPFHLTLAHLIEQDSTYAQWYRTNIGDAINIMDNSAFEMYKQGRDMYPADKLIEMADLVQADYIVMPDYPGQDGALTRHAAEHYADKIKLSGYGTFYVPQSKIGDVEGLVEEFRWAAQSDLVDYIGVSILAVPNAYGVEKNNKLQRYLSRYHLMKRLQEEGILATIKTNNEVDLVLRDFGPIIDTWDSSAAVWAGMCDIEFDDSPTGLINGKNEIEVDFDYKDAEIKQIAKALHNVNYIDNMVTKWNRHYDGFDNVFV